VRKELCSQDPGQFFNDPGFRTVYPDGIWPEMNFNNIHYYIVAVLPEDLPFVIPGVFQAGFVSQVKILHGN